MKIDSTILTDISSHYGPTSVEVSQFFLSYNSVMTLAYESFSRTLLDVKRHVEFAMGGSLKPENTGTKWPKTTLGCLNDGKKLSREELKTIRKLCDTANAKLDALEVEDRRVCIGELLVVVFACRSLERSNLVIPIQLRGKMQDNDKGPEGHKAFVRTVMREFEEHNLNDYFKSLPPEGRTLDAYYRTDHVETTLVADVHFSDKVEKIAKSFKACMNKALKGKYGWFSDDSRHLSLRALAPK